MNDFCNDVRIAIYRAFVENGTAPVVSEIAAAVSSSPARVEQAFRNLHDNRVLVLAPGTPYIWMANPFSALPTPYVVTCEGKSFWGNCIWDALGIITMLGSEGHVAAACPDCSDELQLEVRNGELVHSDLLVHYAVPAARWWDDIGFN